MQDQICNTKFGATVCFNNATKYLEQQQINEVFHDPLIGRKKEITGCVVNMCFNVSVK